LQLFSQKVAIINTIFEDSVNLEITKSLDHKYPNKLYLLKETDTWNKDILFPDNIGKRHAESQNTTTLLDSLLGNRFSKKDRNLLFSKAIHLSSTRIKHVAEYIHLINSIKNIPAGFFFSISEPAYHKKYCLLNLTVYFKDQNTKSVTESYFGQVFFLYQLLNNNSWVLVKKTNNLLL